MKKNLKIFFFKVKKKKKGFRIKKNKFLNFMLKKKQNFKCQV